MSDTFARATTVFRDAINPDDPYSHPYEPFKSEVRALHAIQAAWAEGWVSNIVNEPTSDELPGERYIVGASPTGVFVNSPNCLAILIDDVWNFADPSEGAQLYNRAYDRQNKFDGASWGIIPSTSDALQKTANLSDIANPATARTNLGVASIDDILFAKGPVELVANTPDASPTVGMRRLIGTSPTGVWVGKSNQVAEYFADGWHYSGSPADGQQLYVQDVQRRYKYNSSNSQWKTQNSKVVFMSEFATLALADAFAVAAGMRLMIDEDVTLSANTALSAPSIKFNGGRILRGSYTVSGNFQGDPYDAMFDKAGTGLVTFNKRCPISVCWMGADFGADDLNPFQQAYNSWEVSGGSVRAPGANYTLSGAILNNLSAIIGFKFAGDGRGKTVLNCADDAALFEFHVASLSHSNEFIDFTAQWPSTNDVSKTKRDVIYLPDGFGEFDFYLSKIGCRQNNGHYLVRSEGPSVWGIDYNDIVIGGTQSGGILHLRPNRSTGQPGNTFSGRTYLSGPAAGPIFDTQAWDGDIQSLELNQMTAGPKLISDTSGCRFNIGMFRIEGGVYAVATEFIEVANGYVLADRVEINNLDISAKFYLVSTNDNDSCSRIRYAFADNTYTGSGAFYFSNALGDPNKPDTGVRFGTINCPAGFGATQGLTDVASTAAADSTIVDDWADRSRVAYMSDADLTLTGIEAVNQVARTLSTSRTVKLPANNSNLLFSGRPFVFTKPAVTTGDLVIKDSTAATTYATITAASKGRVEIVWNRSNANGPSQDYTVISSSTWT